jgi:inorganic pyrophosphatase
MPESQFTPDDFVEVRVVEPGDDCNLYDYDPHGQGLRLTGVHRTARPAPGDYATVPDTSPNGQSDLGVLLLSHRATFPGCMVVARPIALLEIRHGAQEECRVIAVPAADEAMERVKTLEDLPGEWRQAIMAFVQANMNGHEDGVLVWCDAAHARQAIHQTRQAARLARAKAGKDGLAAPAWKPLGRRVLGARRASDTEPNTEAEYAYHQLPDRFQRYVDEYLARDERILFATVRPAMQSALRRTWFSSQALQEGVLFITDQQVALVTEILRPGRTNIRYGYQVQTGIPERVEAVAVQPVADHACLEVTWRAGGGTQRVAWEFPAEAAGELAEGAKLLRGWQPVGNDDRRVRRAYGPEPVEVELCDPAANDPADVAPLIHRLEDALAAELSNGERVLARALLPTWADAHKTAHLLAVTGRRALWLPDPANTCHLRPTSFALGSVASVEFKSSILESWLALNVLSGGEVRRTTMAFPYTAGGFQTCFTALRQQLAAVPERV